MQPLIADDTTNAFFLAPHRRVLFLCRTGSFCIRWLPNKTGVHIFSSAAVEQAGVYNFYKYVEQAVECNCSCAQQSTFELTVGISKIVSALIK